MNEPRQQSVTSPTAALLTPRGRGAVATIRFRGDGGIIDSATIPLFQAANGKLLREQLLNRVVFGRWGTENPEEVVVCRTDESSIEIHCHGGNIAANRILDDLQSLGCEIKTWQEMKTTVGRLLEFELLEAITQATTQRTAGILLGQQSGLLRAAMEELQPSGQFESDREAMGAKLDALLAWSEFGLHLSQPWKVVLAGRPNVGKSSLINALLGYARSVVFDQPGTTRDVVTAQTAFDGWPIQFADTAGMRDAPETLEAAGIERARNVLAQADCRVIVLDINAAPTADDRRLLSDWPNAIVVANKCDLKNRWTNALPKQALLVSSLTNQGVDEFAGQIVDVLVPLLPPPETAISVTSRQRKLLQQARNACEQNALRSYNIAIGELLR